MTKLIHFRVNLIDIKINTYKFSYFSRSADKNERLAKEKLRQMIFQKHFEEDMSKLSQSRKSQVGNMDRNEKIRTYNYSRNMITDHRVGVNKQVGNLPKFFMGNLGYEVLEEFQIALADKERKENLIYFLEKEAN